MKSQTSTEYLILISVVIIIGLLVITTLGETPDIGSSSDKQTM